jgi:4-aminobutyrate aminotransferase-like enzyme/Ser/Thr protein kinase RdoA (MazF antagonist)
MQNTHSPRPQFSEQDAIQITAEMYGVTPAKMKELPSDRDQNFYLKTAHGLEFTLKIANSDTRKEELDLQNKAIAHVAGKLGSACCPQVCSTKSGAQITTVQDADSAAHFARLLTYLSGEHFATFTPHSPALLHNLGGFIAKMSAALAGFEHPAGKRYLKWNMVNAPHEIRQYLEHIKTPERRALVEHFLDLYEKRVAPILPALRTSIIHGDANDYNILVSCEGMEANISGIIDFGDMVESYTVCELAITVAYAILDKANPIAAAAHIVQGYHKIFPLTETEIALLYYFICMRLCLSVTMSAYQQKMQPDNEYLKISEKPAWAALKKLRAVHPRYASDVFRHACGLPPCPTHFAVTSWLRSNAKNFSSVVEIDLKSASKHFFDASVGSTEYSNSNEKYNGSRFTKQIFDRMQEVGAEAGIGRYNEARCFYLGDAFKTESDEHKEWRTIHIGIDLFLEPGAPIFAPLDGKIHSFRNNATPFDYGPTIILEHEFENGRIQFYTLYGHLSVASLDGVYAGKPVQKGERIGTIGDLDVNGGWPPHLHFQIILDMLDKEGEFPGVTAASEREVWLSLCPDPNLILGIPEACFPKPSLVQDQILERRKEKLGKSLSISYKKPLTIVHGWMQYLFDDTGRRFLDAVNNVPHVGHCHPRVVEAGQKQMAVLNTNTRYLHETIIRYAERLCAKMPEPLRVCYFVNSGSEANELALRMAKTCTGNSDFIVLDGAYHGNTGALVEISPYKFNGPGGRGKPEHVHVATMPDIYRGRYRANDPQAGEKYAAQVGELIGNARAQGRSIAAFIGESLLGCGGQIVLPEGYFREVFRMVRAAGGVCIADEVQVGFGRAGSHFWGFETQGVVPNIVTLGKPMGNGHPIGAVLTTPEIAEAFNNGMEYFNTYGGNPVSCAIGLAVLNVIEQEKLQENARMVGEYLKAELTKLQTKHRLIGDVRGLGLFLGIELVRHHETLEPAADEASYVVNRMKECGILISTDGPLENVLKIKPPLVFSKANADFFVATLDRILSESVLQ